MKPLLRPFFLFFHSSFLLLSYEVKVSKATMDEVDGCERSSDCIDKYWRTIWIIIGMAIAAYSFMLAWTCWISSKFQILMIKIFQILVKYLVFGLKILCVFVIIYSIFLNVGMAIVAYSFLLASFLMVE